MLSLKGKHVFTKNKSSRFGCFRDPWPWLMHEVAKEGHLPSARCTIVGVGVYGMELHRNKHVCGVVGAVKLPNMHLPISCTPDGLLTTLMVRCQHRRFGM